MQRPDVITETPRLILRTWLESDVDVYDRACNTPDVMRYLGGTRSKRKVREEVRDLIDQQGDYGFTLWVMEEKDTREFLGFCGLDQLDYLDLDDENSDPKCTVKNELELGFRIRRDRWNEGFASEGASVALEWAFKELRARRVVARVARENRASRAVLTRLGMRHDFALDYWPSHSKMVVVYTTTFGEWEVRTNR
jgi:RimJ/RimL family protein N-acetyltransferase